MSFNDDGLMSWVCSYKSGKLYQAYDLENAKVFPTKKKAEEFKQKHNLSYTVEVYGSSDGSK